MEPCLISRVLRIREEKARSLLNVKTIVIARSKNFCIKNRKKKRKRKKHSERGDGVSFSLSSIISYYYFLFISFFPLQKLSFVYFFLLYFNFLFLHNLKTSWYLSFLSGNIFTPFNRKGDNLIKSEIFFQIIRI